MKSWWWCWRPNIWFSNSLQFKFYNFNHPLADSCAGGGRINERNQSKLTQNLNKLIVVLLISYFIYCLPELCWQIYFYYLIKYWRLNQRDMISLRKVNEPTWYDSYPRRSLLPTSSLLISFLLQPLFFSSIFNHHKFIMEFLLFRLLLLICSWRFISFLHYSFLHTGSFFKKLIFSQITCIYSRYFRKKFSHFFLISI